LPRPRCTDGEVGRKIDKVGAWRAARWPSMRGAMALGWTTGRVTAVALAAMILLGMMPAARTYLLIDLKMPGAAGPDATSCPTAPLSMRKMLWSTSR
jgi:hypothetical protein